MTPEAQRIAIANACGWKGPFGKQWLRGYTLEGGDLWAECGIGPDGELDKLPHYLNDLNAMHEAEKYIKDQFEGYYRELATVVQGHVCWKKSEADHLAVFTATAAQRAEAFLRTIGKWEGNR